MRFITRVRVRHGVRDEEFDLLSGAKTVSSTGSDHVKIKTNQPFVQCAKRDQ